MALNQLCNFSRMQGHGARALLDRWTWWTVDFARLLSAAQECAHQKKGLAMVFSGSEVNRSFRPGHEEHISGADSLIDIEPSDLNTDSEEVFLCRRCFQLVTTSWESIDVNGAHNHNFVNPHGIVFEIGCFSAAPGCSYSGDSSGEFTWFKGFRWQVAACRSCLSHLGWLFASRDRSFNGLILENLIMCRQGDESS